ncbi:MAG TPA: helix-turn-helix domain-containing protein [Candidatus Limnocylindrales bacterium]
MPARSSTRHEAAERAHAIRLELSAEARRARIARGLSQDLVGSRIGLSGSQIGRIERGRCGGVSLERLVELLGIVGLEVSVRAYPTGRPLRDEAHRRLLARLRAVAAPTLRWRHEVPLPLPGDLRAWDAVVSTTQDRAAVEAETRPRDVQELRRRIALKQRDAAMPAVILLLAATRSNHALVRADAAALADDFPLPGRDALRILGAGGVPKANSIVLL